MMKLCARLLVVCFTAGLSSVGLASLDAEPPNEPVATPPDTAQMRADAIALLHEAVAATEALDPVPAHRDARRIDLVLGFVRLGELDEADAQLEALDPQRRARFVDTLYEQITRRDTRLRTPWALAHIDAIDNPAQRVTKLLTLAGGMMPGNIDYLDPTENRSYLDVYRGDPFVVQALAMLEERGGFADLPEDHAVVHSNWVDVDRGPHGDIGMRLGWDRYPGRPAVYQALARAHMLQNNFDRALAYVTQLDEAPEVAIETLQDIAARQYVSGEVEASHATLRRASALAAEAVPLRAGWVTRQQAKYGDTDAARAAYVEIARGLVVQPTEDEDQLVRVFNALSHTCQALREVGGDEAADAINREAIERASALPDEHRARTTWPRREASFALLAGDPAAAARYIDLMPAQPWRVEMRHSVVVGWLHKGDAERARAALNTALVDAEAIPPGSWRYSPAFFRDEFEPWITLLEQGESLPIQFNHDERFRAVVAFCEAGEYDAAVAFLDEHSPVGTFTLKHLIVIAHYLQAAGEEQRLRTVLEKAHRVAAGEDLPPGVNTQNLDGIPRFRFLDNDAWRNQPRDGSQAQIFRPTRVTFPRLGQGGRNRAAENWAVSGMADLFTLQLRWGMADHAAQCLEACEHPWLAALAAMFVIDQHSAFLESQYANLRRGLADIEQVDHFERVLLSFSEDLSDEHHAHIRLGLRAVSTQHPDVAQRVIELMPDLPHQHDSQRSTNLQSPDRLAHPEAYPLTNEIYTLSHQAYKFGVLGRSEQCSRVLQVMGVRADEFEHPASRAAMLRLTGGIALTFGDEDFARFCFDRAIAMFAEEDGLWTPPEGRDEPWLSQARLTRVLHDLIKWRVMLEMDEAARAQAAEAIRRHPAPNGHSAEMQFLIGETDAAHAALIGVLQGIAQQRNLGERRKREQTQQLLDLYLEVGEPGLAWDAILAIEGWPRVRYIMLPYIAQHDATASPDVLRPRVEALEDPLLRTSIYSAAANGLVERIAPRPR